jgi:ATP-dependent protease ClpP protease subunit
MSLLLIAPCRADTFTHRETGEVFYGYATREKGAKNTTLVYVKGEKSPKYLNLAEYDVEWNYLGRRDRVFVLSIKDEVKLECETEAFERSIYLASNQGPLVILIEIDTPGGRKDLMERLCATISETNNCRTIAFICGGKYGGAYSAGAAIALACDYIYIANDTAIGAATPIILGITGYTDYKSLLGETVGEKFMSAVRAYIAAIAEKKGRSGLLAKAMVDKDIEVLEVIENGKSIFVEPENKKEGQLLVHTWSRKGTLLTLTAAEAVKCRMADKLVGSRKELISDLKLAKARIIQDKYVREAREKFKKAEQKMEIIKNNIDYYTKKIDPLINRISWLATEYNRLNRSYAINKQELMAKVNADREGAIYNLLSILENLGSDCKEAIKLKNAHTDLNIDIEQLEKLINSTAVLYEQFRDIY